MKFFDAHNSRTRRTLRNLGFFALATQLVACLESPNPQDDSDSGADSGNTSPNDPGQNSDQQLRKTVDMAINKNVDVLFVVDNSGSMGEEQGALAKNFSSFVEVLEQEGVKANYRLGVTTADMGHSKCPYPGDRGVLKLKSCLDREEDFTDPLSEFSRFNTACQSVCKYRDEQLQVLPTTVEGSDKAIPRAWIERIDGQSNLADKTITSAEAFACFAPQGIKGCGYEAQLESMYMALLGAQSEENLVGGKANLNFGFMRKSAILAVVHVSDEFDCSLNTENEVLRKEPGDYYEKVFGKESGAFWSMGQESPSSANCLHAGVRCSGTDGENYESCVAIHKDVDGQVIASQDPGEIAAKAVLRPVSKYVDLLTKIENEKKSRNPDQQVVVALIGGVSGDNGEVVYRRGYDGTELERKNFNFFGIGFGCSKESSFLAEKNPENPGEIRPGGTEPGFAVPPVRMKELAEAMRKDPSQQVLYSICNDDFSAPLRNIAEKIRDQIGATCYDGCVADSKPEIPRIVPNCDVFEVSQDQSQAPMVECLRQNNDPNAAYVYDEQEGRYALPPGAELCYVMLTDAGGQHTVDPHDNLDASCVQKRSNLEFKVQRRQGGRSDQDGTQLLAVCDLASHPDLSCPAP